MLNDRNEENMTGNIKNTLNMTKPDSKATIDENVGRGNVKLYDEEDCMKMSRYLGQAAPEISPDTSYSVCTLGQTSNIVGVGDDVIGKRFSDFARPDYNSRKVDTIDSELDTS